MSQGRAAFLAVQADQARKQRLSRAKNDLWFLSSLLGRHWNPEAGGKDSPYHGRGLSTELHQPICGWFDANRNEERLGLYLARFHHKSELVIHLIVQQILRDPCETIGYFHWVDLLASQIVEEVAHHLQFNNELRKLEPIGYNPATKEHYNILPPRPKPGKSNKFATADQFTVNRHQHSRFPTLFGRGVNSSMTGLHMGIAFIDDIIDRNTVMDSQLGKVRDWYESTLCPVVDGNRIRSTGTLWDREACYMEWIESAAWKTVVIPCSTDPEHDFIETPSLIDWTAPKIRVPYDPKLRCPTYGPLPYRDKQRSKLFFLQKEMGHNFPPQMGLDPSPPGEKPWNPASMEHFITLKEAAGPGLVVVFSDPAPAKTGSISKKTGKTAAIYTVEKDDWTHAVVKLRRRGQRNEIILLQLSGSLEWDLDQGFEEMCRLQRQWSSRRTAVEKTGQAIALYDARHREIARREGVAHSPIELTMTYLGKNVQFGALCARAAADEFLICESVEKKFLDPEAARKAGRDPRRTFFHQARNWRPMKQGVGSENGLPYDDFANVVCFACDPVLSSMVPTVSSARGGFDPLADEAQEEQAPRRSAYCGI